MSTAKTHISTNLAGKLSDIVLGAAHEVLAQIEDLELPALAKINPTFAEIAKDCEILLASLEYFFKNEVLQLRMIKELYEYVEILESIAKSIIDMNNSLLIDNISHLREFLEINTRRGEAHGN